MDIMTLVRQFPQKSFVKGELIMSEGDISDTILAISTGFVKVTAIDDNGNERLLWIAGRYDIAPTERLFTQSRPLRFFYTALTDGAAYCINKQQFLGYAKKDLGIMTEIAASMADHYDDLLSRVHSVEQSSVQEKLIATLRYLAQRFSAEQNVDLYSLGLRITHQDLADMISSTRETTSLELQKLRRNSYIDYDSSKFVVHLDKCVVR
jgi:CRP/FNR family transcriptional regulator